MKTDFLFAIAALVAIAQGCAQRQEHCAGQGGKKTCVCNTPGKPSVQQAVCKLDTACPSNPCWIVSENCAFDCVNGSCQTQSEHEAALAEAKKA